MNEWSHLDENGRAIMVDITQKEQTIRTAQAVGEIWVGQTVLMKIKNSEIEKGDVLASARIAGILAAKRTYELIPLCHVLQLTKCQIDFKLNEEEGTVQGICTVKTVGKTGAEMEALTGVQIALLTIYDMCKAMHKNMVIRNVHLLAKTGGKSGDYQWKG
jgi:cyclic pyranopterin phosphate synthase